MLLHLAYKSGTQVEGSTVQIYLFIMMIFWRVVARSAPCDVLGLGRKASLAAALQPPSSRHAKRLPCLVWTQLGSAPIHSACLVLSY